MVKNRILTNSFRTIKNLFARFLTLLIISFLGTFVFLGLFSTAPNMLHTIDVHFDNANVYDIKIVSTLGLTDDDINVLKNIDGVDEIEGSKAKDVLVTLDDEEYVVNIESLSNSLNNIEIIDGRLPINENEIVVEKNVLIDNEMELGDSITFSDDSFKYNELTIVGVCDYVYYFSNTDLSQNRGTTNVGAGTINYYSYVLPSLFDVDYYTYIYIGVDNADDLLTNSEEYNNLIDSVKDRIESIANEREEARFNEDNDLLTKEIKDIFDPLYEDLKLDKEALDTRLNELNLDKEYLDNLNKEIKELKEEYNLLISNLNINEEDIDNRINELEELLLNMDEASYLYSEYLNELNNLKSIKSIKEEIELKENEYASLLDVYNNELEDYNDDLAAYNQEKMMVDYQYRKANKMFEDIPKSTWLVMDRSDYLTYTEYVEDTSSIANLAKIFPLLFFAVACLISLVSMNRMVEDDRTEIGTLKSLGFSNKHIVIKYLMYSFLATIIGGILGSILGAIILPSVIFSVYTLLFDLPRIYLEIEWGYFIIGVLVNFILVGGTTLYSVLKVVLERPSELMRPRAPKSGRRVFLERIPSIWSKMKFSNKVTIRNLFRYKKRALVTILGVAGCTALMMTGFGVKDAIIDIPDRQFGDIFTFDAMVYVGDYDSKDDYVIFENDKITATVDLQNINASVGGRKASMFVIEDNKEMDKFINLIDHETKEKVDLEDGKIAITKKLATLENIHVGDKLKFNDTNNIIYEYEVSVIIEHYIEHYIFMDKDTYELSGEEFTPNTVCIQTIDLTSEEEEALSEELLLHDKVIYISYVSELVDRVKNMLTSLDKVVLILIILASLLSFVVLYNLSSINVQERERELATLKVLGFYDKEVDSYITKENYILTFIGIAIGLFIGVYLSRFVISTVEIEKATFMKDLKLMSHVYSAALTILFTISVNYITHFALQKINMIESLKSVE